MHRHPTSTSYTIPIKSYPGRRRVPRTRTTSNRKLVYFISAICLLSAVILLPGALVKSISSPSTYEHRINTQNIEIKTAVSADRDIGNGVIAGDVGVAPIHVPPMANEEGNGGDGLSIVVLFHNEYDTLNHTLESWERNGLYHYASEVLFFLNGVPSEKEFMMKLPRLKGGVWKGMTRIVVSEENLKLGLAITKMVELAKEEVVLLLEKDWALIEEREVVGMELKSARRLLKEGGAHVIRFRHRDLPGAPLHARIMHEGREQQMLDQQKNLYCYLHHWVKDLGGKYPEYFKRCSNRTEDLGTWCASAKFCQWTNNPAMFRKKWFLKELGDKYADMYAKTIKKEPTSGMLDFEFYTNWQHDVWNDRDFVVALPKGLFEHQEVGEQNLMNTVWYAWNRLHTDTVEKYRALLASEVKDCSEASKSMDSGPAWKDKFPIDFVRLYHYDMAMTRTVEEAVLELKSQALKSRKYLEEGQGTWRHGITDLTNLWYTTVLFKYPEEPEVMDITTVTSLHTEEGNLSDADLEIFYGSLRVVFDYRIIVFTNDATKKRVEKMLKSKSEDGEELLNNIKFIVQSTGEAMESLLSKENVERIDKLQSNKTWQKKAKERSGHIPSATDLKISMAKPYMVQAALEEWTGTHFVWIDALSPCLQAMKESNSTLNVSTDTIFRANLLLNVFTTGVRARSESEIDAALGDSGFPLESLLQELEATKDSIESGIVLADLQTIGGSKLAVTLMAGYYDMVLRDTLRHGALGNGREALSIVYKNVDYNFQFFDSREACRNGDTCATVKLDAEYAKNRNGGCALFRWASGCVSSGP